MSTYEYALINAWNASGTLVPHTAEQLESRGWIRRSLDGHLWLVTEAGRKAGLR